MEIPPQMRTLALSIVLATTVEAEEKAAAERRERERGGSAGCGKRSCSINLMVGSGRDPVAGVTSARRPPGVALGVAGMAALVVPVVIGILNAPASWSQEQSGTPARPQFEVASVKPNNGCENALRPRSGNFSPSPGRLEMPCVDLLNLIQAAFGTFGDGVSVNTQPLHIEHGPKWMQSEHYSLSAKAAGARTEMLAGPMLQALLEERFRLKTHRETREIPVYAITAAKGRLKVQPLAEGACTAIDLTHPPPPRKPGDPPPNLCGLMIVERTGKGDMMIEVRGATMTQFAQRLSGRVDRTVVDKTGIPGKFNFHLEFTPDPNIPGQSVLPGGGSPGNVANPSDPAPPPDPGPNLFVALQEQIGLKLSSDKGPVSVLIIDHVEKPTAN